MLVVFCFIYPRKGTEPFRNFNKVQKVFILRMLASGIGSTGLIVASKALSISELIPIQLSTPIWNGILLYIINGK